MHAILGTGPLARATMRALLRRGASVTMISRGAAPGIPPEVVLLHGDASRPEEAARLTAGASVIYQCAQPAYHRWPQEFPALQRAVLAAAEAGGARLVLAENLYGYGPVDGPMHEDLPLLATTRKGSTRARMTEEALAAFHEGRVRVAIARGSDFFGPHVLLSALGAMVFRPALRGGTARFGGSLDQPHSFTYIEDFGEAMAVLGERDEALGRAWHVPNDRPGITQREIAELIFAEAGRPPRIAGTGRTLLRLVGLFNPGARESVEMLYEFERPFVVDSSRFETTFGKRATPLRQALRETVAWYREQATK